MAPLLDQSHLEVAWHAGQYQALPRGLRPEQRARDRLDARRHGDGDARGRGARAVPHARARGLQRRRRGGLGASRAPRRGRRGDAPRGRAATRMLPPRERVASLETLFCDAGWRPWIFLKATTDDGLVGWAEITDSHGSPRGLAGIVEDLAPLVVGRDPAPGRGDLLGSLPRDAPEPGLGHREGARRDRERAPRRQGEGARRARLRALRRADARDDPDVLVALRHDARARVRGDRHAEARLVRRRRGARSRGRRAGYAAFKTNVVVPGDDPKVLMPGFNEGGGTLRADEIADALVRLLEAFAEGTRRRGAADRRPQLQPRARGLRARCEGTRAVRPALARGRSLRSRQRSRTSATSRRCRSARGRTSTAAATSARTSRPAAWTSRRST